MASLAYVVRSVTCRATRSPASRLRNCRRVVAGPPRSRRPDGAGRRRVAELREHPIAADPSTTADGAVGADGTQVRAWLTPAPDGMQRVAVTVRAGAAQPVVLARTAATAVRVAAGHDGAAAAGWSTWTQGSAVAFARPDGSFTEPEPLPGPSSASSSTRAATLPSTSTSSARSASPTGR